MDVESQANWKRGEIVERELFVVILLHHPIAVAEKFIVPLGSFVQEGGVFDEALDVLASLVAKPGCGLIPDMFD